MRTCDAAALVLRETDNPAVMWGDEGLLHMIANRAGLRTCHRAWKTSDAVLRNLSGQPGALIAGHTLTGSGRRVRCFWLPEHAPERYRATQLTPSDVAEAGLAVLAAAPPEIPVELCAGPPGYLPARARERAAARGEVDR